MHDVYVATMKLDEAPVVMRWFGLVLILVSLVILGPVGAH